MSEKLFRPGDDLDLGYTRPISPSTAPGKSTLTAKLFRRPVRDDRGVAEGAEVSVDRAAGSSGSALPDELRERFESSLGADLSGVRVHTGADSQTAAGAVGARAYTVGDDIHFGAGQYDPSSHEGLFLIAHEVAHTVQQSGSTPTRQNKLDVSSSDDAAEVEADRAATAMVSGEQTAVSVQPTRIHRTDDPFLESEIRSEGADGPVVVHPDWSGPDIQRYNSTFANVDPAHEVDWSSQVSPDESGVPEFNEVLQFSDDCMERLSAYFFFKSTTGGCKAVDAPIGGGITRPDECRVNELDARQGSPGPYMNAIIGVWQATRAATGIAKPAIDDYGTAAQNPVLNNLTGTGTVISDAQAQKDPLAEGSAMGVLQKDTFDKNLSLDQAVLSGQPMTGSKMKAGGESVSIGEALTTDLADQGAKRIQPDTDLQKKVGDWKAAESNLQSVTADLRTAQDDTPLQNAVSKAQNALSKAQNDLTAKENDQKSASVEQDKTAVVNCIGILSKFALAKDKTDVVGDVAGYVVGGLFDQQINKYKNANLALATESAKLGVADAQTAVKEAQAALDAQAKKMVKFKNDVVTAEDKRRTTLNEVANLASKNALDNGADEKHAAAIQAKIKALPAIEVVIAATQRVLNAITVPGYTQESGVGACVVDNIDAMIGQVSKLAGGRSKYQRVLTEWEARRKDVEAFITGKIM